MSSAAFSAQQRARLAERIDQERLLRGWSLQELTTRAQVSRPVISRLINHAEIPGRRSTRDAIGSALGWQCGSCDSILAGGEPADTHRDVRAGQDGARLGQRIDQARRDVGLSKNDIARISGVSRAAISRLVNHGEVPARRAVRDAIGAAVGWQAGSCEVVLGGGEPTVGGPAQASRLIAARLEAIARELDGAAADARVQAERFGAMGAAVRASAALVLRGGVSNFDSGS